MLRRPKVLLLTGDDSEASALQETIGDYITLLRARSLPEMKSQLENEDCDVLVCAGSFYQNGWDSVLSGAHEQHPNLPVIVVSPKSGELEWAKVLEAGAFNLLAWPCQKTIVLGAVGQAVTSHDASRASSLTSGEQARERDRPSVTARGTRLLVRAARRMNLSGKHNGDCSPSVSKEDAGAGAGSAGELPLLWLLMAVSNQQGTRPAQWADFPGEGANANPKHSESVAALQRRPGS